MKATRITLYTDNNGVEHRTKQDCEIADLSAELKTQDLQELKAIVQRGLNAAKLIKYLTKSGETRK